MRASFVTAAGLAALAHRYLATSLKDMEDIGYLIVVLVSFGLLLTYVSALERL